MDSAASVYQVFQKTLEECVNYFLIFFFSVVQDAIAARWYSKDTTVTLSLATAFLMFSYRSSAWVAMTFSPVVYEVSHSSYTATIL